MNIHGLTIFHNWAVALDDRQAFQAFQERIQDILWTFPTEDLLPYIAEEIEKETIEHLKKLKQRSNLVLRKIMEFEIFCRDLECEKGYGYYISKDRSSEKTIGEIPGDYKKQFISTYFDDLGLKMDECLFFEIETPKP